MEITYNCWHGCHKKSEGCLNCYVYRRDESIGLDANDIHVNKTINLPILKNKKGEYKYPSGTVFMLCFSSDFFLKDADEFRSQVLEIIKERSDCDFFCITKRPERIKECIPNLNTYTNLSIACTCENQKRIDERLPIYLALPLLKKEVMIEPILEEVDISKYINKIDLVTVGGESGLEARICDFAWVKKLRDLCLTNNVEFYYHQTGAKLLVNGKLYNIPRNKQHSQAQKAFK